MHSLITTVQRNEIAGWYETFRYHAYLSINLQKCRVLLIVDSIIANFSKFSSIFDKHLSQFNTFNFGIGGEKLQNVVWRINNMPFHLLYNVLLCTVVQTTVGIMIQRLFQMA